MSKSNQQLSLDFSIIDTRMTVESMRNSGYKSTTHALAELVDNSIEAGATAIEIFGISRAHVIEKRTRANLTELAVLDNGSGMDANTLRGSLRYGHGTREARKGIGRFGLGLPNSSMSQATRVDVWSWQSGATNALHTWLSIPDVERGKTEIPEPELKAVPDVYREHSLHGFHDSGTLVVWSDLDRVEWKQASTTFKNTELLLGRIYRRFLAQPSERLHSGDGRGDEIGHQRTITCIPVEEDDDWHFDEKNVVEVRPNDPLYLMNGTSCPEEFGPGPMFVELSGSPFSVSVVYKDKPYEIRVRASYARPHVRDSGNPDAAWPDKWIGNDSGSAPWGKHANQNIGVSIMRAHREIQLDKSWINSSDARERWWTIEVDIPTALDDLFGVTNNKQGATTFQRLAEFDWRRNALPGEGSIGDVRRRMEEDGDHRVHLLDLKKQMENAIGLMRPRVQESVQKRGPRHIANEDQKADAKSTSAIKRRVEEGHDGQSDRVGKSSTEEERKEAQVESLVKKHHLDERDALQRIDETIRTGSRVRWIQSLQSSSAFFDVEALPNVLQVALNTKHPVHAHLYQVMHPEVDELSEDELRERLARSAAAFRILIYAWARYEDEQTDRHRYQVQNTRWEWGKYAYEFFDEGDDSIAPTDLV